MKPDISIFFPAYNERENIPKLLSSAQGLLKEIAGNYEILVVVYEGSSDGTIDIVRQFARKNRKIRLVLQPREKKGVGYAITMGLRKARYPYVFYADSDNQFDLGEIKKFLPYIHDYGIIAGYRIKRRDPLMRIIVSKVYNLMMRLIFNVRERDLDCAFRLVSKRVINNVNLMCSTGLATTEILAKARKKGFKIKEIGVHHYPRLLGQPVFESGFLNIPKPGVVLNLIKEMALLYRDLGK